jgi:gliding motility-associated-like protein
MRMRRFPYLLLLCVPSLCAAQHWATKCGGLGNERVSDVKSDLGDGVFSIGEFGPGSTVAGQPMVSQGLSDVFVMKQSAGGALQWLTQAGGTGLDLAGRVCAAADGSVVVCGQFAGTADLFGTSVTAQGGSTDFFVAKLSGTNGSALWVRTGGSAAYTDRAAGVAVGADGRVVVTGEFRGTGVFDAGTFNSTIDPGTSLPGSDVFIASYTADGTAEWFKQGIAERNDQAADVTIDASGATYACGLYSEDISFGTPHPNVALNQMYLVKFDASGNEQWFRRIGGAALQRPTDMQVGDGGGLFLCGDVQGTLTFFDGSPNTVPSAQPNAYFLLRATTDGEFESGIAIGSVNPVSVVGLDQRGATVAVYGSFDCGFADLQSHYNATGIFIATGEEDLFIAKHDAQSTALVEAQQFGGHLEKNAGGITSLSDGELVFCGDFSELLIFPSEGDGWGEGSNNCPPLAEGSSNYCGDAHYTSYEWIRSSGQRDGFIARGYVDSREPYDPYVREGSGCDRSPLDLVLASMENGVTDNSLVCDHDFLYWTHNIPRPGCPDCSCPPDSTVSWAVTDLWSTGEDVWDTLVVLNSGWYWRTHQSSNGCYDVTDSIYVTVLPAPSAWISIDDGPSFAAAPFPLELSFCDAVTLLAADLVIGETYQWYVDGVAVTGNPIIADEDGEYTLTVMSPNGCSATNILDITLLDSLTLPNVTGADFEFSFNGVPLDVQDTVQACGAGGCQSGPLIATWYVDGVPTVLSQPIFVYYGTEDGCGFVTTYADLAMDWDQYPEESGWYPLHVHIVMHIEGCSDDTLAFDAYDSVYFETGFTPVIQPFEDFPMCIGDTAMVVLDCTGCDEVEWSGPNGTYITSPGLDTAWVWGFGLYSVIASNAEGFLCEAVEYFVVSEATPPPLFVDPIAVCPGDTALLYTSFASVVYEWSGPSGPIPVDNDSLFITETGSYYLTAYTAQGCQLFNGPAILQQFATPSLGIVPDDVLCPGESAALVISGGGLETIVWDPPLSGSDLTQPVNAAGIYTCTVTACGNAYQLSATIHASSITASIPPGPFTICGGGSALLDGPTGDYDYLWTPGNIATEDLLADAPGNYQLQLTDSLGCTATSNIVQVVEQSFTQQLTTSGDTICPGDDALLTAAGSGVITWFADAGAQDTLLLGDQLTITGAQASDTVFVAQTEDGCTGPLVPVIITVAQPPAPPVISGDTSLCIGDALSLSVPAEAGVSYTWATPQGVVSGAVVSIAAVTATDIGTYVCTASIGDCPGSQASVELTLELGPEAPVITGETALCVGDPLFLSVEAIAGITYAWTTPLGEEDGPVVELSGVLASDAGSYVCVPSAGVCGGEAAEVQVTVQTPPLAPIVVGPDTLCDGEFGSVTVTGILASFTWVTPGGTSPGTVLGYPIWAATPEDSGDYGVIMDGGSCPDVSAFIHIVVDPCEVTLPNVFTPNSDGQNDYFIIEGTPGVTYYFHVYNRWGQQVYSPPRSEFIRWNGRDDNNDLLPDGVYYYELMRVTFGAGRSITGYIQLMRGR